MVAIAMRCIRMVLLNCGYFLERKTDLVIYPDRIRLISQEAPNRALINFQVVPDQVRDALWREALLKEEVRPQN